MKIFAGSQKHDTSKEMQVTDVFAATFCLAKQSTFAQFGGFGSLINCLLVSKFALIKHFLRSKSDSVMIRSVDSLPRSANEFVDQFVK